MNRPPFVWIAGRPYLVVNYTIPPDDLPPLTSLLASLLEHQPAENVMLLRRLTKAEVALVEKVGSAFEREAWARLVVSDRDRFSGGS
jgi:hypothetical protein